MQEEERWAAIEEAFEAYFGASPEHWSRAPGRVDLMGSHTDYNHGFVMTMTVDRDTWIAARPRADRIVRVRSLNVAGESQFSLDNIQQDDEVTWSNYVRGMANVMQDAGYALQGFDGLVHSTVPFGSGLSSSAAIEMATAEIFQQVSGFTLDPLEMALFGQKAENEFVGVRTGILDQYSSALGEAGCALELDCRHLTSKTSRIADGLAVVICDTCSERKLAGSEYDDRRKQCEEGVAILQQYDASITALRDATLALFEAHEAEMPAVVAKRCRFIIEENQRVLDLASALPKGDHETLGALFRDSYTGARDLFEINAPSMTAMIQVMQTAPGLVGARQAGAGFGGCMVALVDEAAIDAFADHVSQTYKNKTTIRPRVFVVSAAAGAGPLSRP